MARGAGGGGGAIILNIPSKGGDYSRDGYYSRKYGTDGIQTSGNFAIHLYRPNRS